MTISFRCTDDLVAAIRARGEVSESIRSGLERYYHLLERGRARLREVLTGSELALLADLCNSTLWEPHTLGLIHAEVGDAEDAYFAKWGVDKDALAGKLRGFALHECAALVDAIERFWAASATGIPVDPTTMLHD